MSAPGSMRARERGAALLIAVAMTAALSVVVGGIGLFALADVRIAAASRDHAQAVAAAEAALEIAVALLAGEPDLAAVRAGTSTAPRAGSPRLVTLEGDVDVDRLTRGLVRARGGLPPPWGSNVWRPYLWGRLGELVTTPARVAEDPLVVVWVRGDIAAGGGADDLELAVEAVTPRRGQAAATGVVHRRALGFAVGAVWPDSRLIDQP